MTISATEGVSPFLIPNTSAASASSASSLGDQNTFMQLLVAQMKYQDPMNPSDSSQQMSQMAQFSALQEMTTIAHDMQTLIQSQNAFGAASMIGRTVHYTDTNGVEQSGTVDGTTFTATGPLLSIGGTAVAMTSVTSVGSAPTLPTAGPTGSASTPTGYVPNSTTTTA